MTNSNFSCRCQYEPHVNTPWQSSACGPTAVASILEFYMEQNFSINMLYKKLHCTRLGLPSHFLLYYLPKLLGSNWIVKKTTLNDALQEIDRQHLVAVKFDRYFNRKFWRKPHFDYHWTVLVDYKIHLNQLYLIVEDLGSPSRPSQRQHVLYEDSKHALTFIKIHPI
ncbi:MAG: hypothetical protein KBT36_05850 [Kurthia sp.]|nr:hypothetical protein [Candidatus Kurthia equi]